MKRIIISVLSVLAVIGILAGTYYVGQTVIYKVAYVDEIKAASRQYNVDPYLLTAVISKESAFNDAVITKYDTTDQYHGGINLTDAAASAWAQKAGITLKNKEDITNPKTSIQLAAYILSDAQSQVGNNNELIIKKFLERNNEGKSNPKYIEETNKSIFIYKFFHPELGN